MYKSFLKRFFDLTMASIAFIITLPILLLSIFFVLIVTKSNPFFIQQRPGKNETFFKIIKLKTMSDEKDGNGNLLPDSERLTLLGKVIRKLSIDELPQLINVIKGDMSIVGPRPLLVEYLPLYNKKQRKRHLVRPGITGWAQINGRNNISWEQKFEYDVWYIENISFFLDLKILFLTIQKISKSEGINQAQNITMETFKGNF